MYGIFREYMHINIISVIMGCSVYQFLVIVRDTKIEKKKLKQCKQCEEWKTLECYPASARACVAKQNHIQNMPQAARGGAAKSKAGSVLSHPPQFAQGS